MISLVGNKRVISTVQNFVFEKRIPHAILISGEYGTGKHTLANYISTAAVCGEKISPCLKCHNCHLADIGSHPDINIITPSDGKKNISVAQIRSLRNEAFIKPHQAPKRVFIIDFADTMNEQSQNALLKILEEPPVTVIFILIAENTSALLETVISRCTLLPLTAPEFSEAFDYIKSRTDFPSQRIKEILINEKNNIGRTENILNGISASKTEAAASEYLKFSINLDKFSMLKTVSPFSKSRIDAENFVKDLKYSVAQKIHTSPKGIYAKAFMKIYCILPEFENSLSANINLNLLFCSLTSKITELIRRNK